MSEIFMDAIMNSKQHAAEILTRKHDFTITITDLEFWAWRSTFGGTNPHGAGGNATTRTVIGWENLFHGDGVLYCAGKYRYVNRFKPMMRWKVEMTTKSRLILYVLDKKENKSWAEYALMDAMYCAFYRPKFPYAGELSRRLEVFLCKLQKEVKK